jgi:hypothetical protein
MTSPPGFTVDIDQNPYLPAGGHDVSAVVTVTAEASGDTPPEPGTAAASAEIIIVDRSGSMRENRKIVQACAATVAAVDVIRDGTWFAIIGGARYAHSVYPAKGSMALADERTREEAKQAARKLQIRGGTAMSTWLRLAHRMFQSCPATLRHAILLTDGDNLEPQRKLAAAIALCEGTFRCDCRGVGTDWQVSELRKISTALLGTVDIVPDPEGLAADFEEMMRGAMSKRLPDVSLRVWTPQQATVRFVKQVAPAIDDLTARRVQSGPQVAGTHDEELSTRINRRVAHYAGQQELADAIQEGLEASKRGDGESATARLGRAVALAHQAGNEDTARLLAKVVDVVDEATGTVRLKKKVEAADEMALDTRSTKTVQVKK